MSRSYATAGAAGPICRSTHSYLSQYTFPPSELSLRKAAVVAREVFNVIGFIDYDIAIYNYLELNSKEGYQSRVVRKVET